MGGRWARCSGWAPPPGKAPSELCRCHMSAGCNPGERWCVLCSSSPSTRWSDSEHGDLAGLPTGQSVSTWPPRKKYDEEPFLCDGNRQPRDKRSPIVWPIVLNTMSSCQQPLLTQHRPPAHVTGAFDLKANLPRPLPFTGHLTPHYSGTSIRPCATP